MIKNEQPERLPFKLASRHETLRKAKARAKARVWREPFIASLVTDVRGMADAVENLNLTLAEYKVVFNRTVIKDDGSPELKKILTREGQTAALRRLQEIENQVRDFRFRLMGESEVPE